MPTATPVRRCSRSNACSCCCLPRKAGPGWPSGNCDASVVGGGENVANVPDGTVWLKGRDAGSVKVRVRVRPLMSCQADRLATFARLREKVTEGRMRALAAPVVPNALHPTSQNAPPPRPYAPSDQRSAQQHRLSAAHRHRPHPLHAPTPRLSRRNAGTRAAVGARGCLRRRAPPHRARRQSGRCGLQPPLQIPLPAPRHRDAAARR